MLTMLHVTGFFFCFALQMAHDPATARDYYLKNDAQKQASEIQERMRQAYGLVDAMPLPGCTEIQVPVNASQQDLIDAELATARLASAAAEPGTASFVA